MNSFWLWFSTGVEHILALNGYDHILFIVLLSLSYRFNKIKKLLVLISAFTIGHSLSLAFSVVYNLHINTSLIEFFIALSLLIAACYQLLQYKTIEVQKPFLIISIICFFGLIHGIAFSYLLKSMLGKEESLVYPLFYFNLGIEVGQILIVLLVLVFYLLLDVVLKFSYKNYKLVLVCSILLISLMVSIERFLLLF